MKKTFKVFAPKWIYKLALTTFLISILISVLIWLIGDSGPEGIIVFAVPYIQSQDMSLRKGL